MKTKRIWSLILLGALVAGMIPAMPLQAKAGAQDDILTQVERQVNAYVKSISQKDSATTAATAMLTNAAFRGKDLSMDESNALTATIANSFIWANSPQPGL